MTEQQIERFLKLLGAQQLRRSGDWVQTNCLFAPWFHRAGTDDRPSFGMKVGDGHFHCFGCHRAGDPVRLLMLLRHHGLLIPEEADRMAAEYIRDRPLFQQEEIIEQETEPTFADEEALDPYPEFTTQFPYLRQRGLLPLVIREYDVRWDAVEQRVLIPVRDGNGRLLGAVGRSINGAVPPYKNYWLHERGRFAMLGEHLHGSRPVSMVVVEGPFDALHVAQADPQVWPLSMLGAGVSQEKMSKLAEYATRQSRVLYVWPDRDEAGREMLSRLRRLRDLVSLFEVRYPDDFEGKDPAEFLQSRKLSRPQFRHLLSQATLV